MMTLRPLALSITLAALLPAPAAAEDVASPAPPVRIDLPPIAARPTGQRLPGKVIWFDLLSHDPARARPFYEGVLGWTFEDKGAYAMARDGGLPVAGIIRMPEAKEGAPAPQSRWMPLISVVDVGRTAAAVQKAGGRILEGPGSLGARGPYVAAADPRGAQFVLVTAAGGDPADLDAPPPGWMWAELWTDDLKGSATFYRTVVGYETWQVGAGKQATWIFASGGRPRARAARMPFQKVPSQWLPYVVVKDLATALGRVTELGGTVLRKPTAKGAQFAVVADPGGAAFILEQRPEPPAEEVAKAPAAGAADGAAAGTAAAAATGAPKPPPDPGADVFGLDEAQRKSQQEADAQAAAQSGALIGAPGADMGAQVIVATPSPFANVWIAPPAWGPYWGPGWGMAPGWVGAPWWGAPPYWGGGYGPYYPGGGAYYPGYRPPPPGYRPGTGPRPPAPGYRPPAPGPRVGAPSARPAPSSGPSRSAPASAAPRR